MSGSRGERAYSLIELVVVLSLVGILLSLAVHSIRLAAAREEIDGWVRGVAADLSSGQQDAITRRASVRATFMDQTYTIAVDGGAILRQEILPGHITFGSPQQQVVFDRRGVPSAPLTLTVSSISTGRSYTIQVAGGTGRVSYSEQ
ncbi:MAG: prepilin-type N-terminal cleavage/methylation domain-containing protein [Armatimonadetes bacterium]|nr:prepilin-type N-terminal cleavage/methylation domain-containing protein [Armatimonadota bacterium]